MLFDEPSSALDLNGWRCIERYERVGRARHDHDHRYPSKDGCPPSSQPGYLYRNWIPQRQQIDQTTTANTPRLKEFLDKVQTFKNSGFWSISILLDVFRRKRSWDKGLALSIIFWIVEQDAVVEWIPLISSTFGPTQLCEEEWDNEIEF